MSSRSSPPPPEECAICGAAIPRGAKACPGCGADERTGWRDQSLYDGLELPDTAWDETAVTDEGGDPDAAPADPHRARPGETARERLRRADHARARRGELPWYWLATAAFLALFLGLGALALLRR